MPIDPASLPPGLRAFVEDDVALLPTGLSEPERTQLLEVLRERGDVARLDRLGGSPDKVLAKEARRALHLLRTKGKASPQAKREYRVVGPYAEPPVASQASIVDGRGERVLWYVDPGDGGYSIFEAELSETAGIIALTAVDVSRKAWRDQLAHMKRSDRAITGEIPGVHARVLLERAYRQMQAAGRSPPETYARLHRRLQATDEELAAPHPLRALVETVPDPSEGELAALLERPELSLLVPSREAFGVLDTAVGEVVTSKLVLDPQQKLAQLEATIVRVCDETLDAAQRGRLADRLLELGLLVHSRQPDEAGRRAARACLVAADRCADLSIAPHDHPTLLAMYRRLVPAELALSLSEPSPR